MSVSSMIQLVSMHSMFLDIMINVHNKTCRIMWSLFCVCDISISLNLKFSKLIYVIHVPEFAPFVSRSQESIVGVLHLLISLDVYTWISFTFWLL